MSVYHSITAWPSLATPSECPYKSSYTHKYWWTERKELLSSIDIDQATIGPGLDVVLYVVKATALFNL